MPDSTHTYRPAIERIAHIHRALRDQSFPNCRKLANAIEVSTKTILRDIAFMRYRLALPVAYDSRRWGFYYTRKVNGLFDGDTMPTEIQRS